MVITFEKMYSLSSAHDDISAHGILNNESHCKKNPNLHAHHYKGQEGVYKSERVTSAWRDTEIISHWCRSTKHSPPTANHPHGLPTSSLH